MSQPNQTSKLAVMQNAKPQFPEFEKFAESIKSQEIDFDIMLQKCRDYALRRRLEHSHKGNKDDMDVDAVHGYTEEGVYMGGGHWECPSWEYQNQDLYLLNKDVSTIHYQKFDMSEKLHPL